MLWSAAMPDIPLAIATEITARFVAGHVSRGATILEVGSGHGDLALALGQRGFVVTAIDADVRCVEQAIRRGVHALRAEWPDFDAPAFDAVAFTRSLHHMMSVPKALEAAHRLLRPGGTLLLDDFAFEAADAAAVNWLRAEAEALRASSLLDLDADGPPLLPLLQASRDPLGDWNRYHAQHGVHHGAELVAAVAQRFRDCVVSGVPYLYRCLIPRLLGDARGAAAARACLERERQAIAAGAIPPLGRHVVARRDPDHDAERRA